MQTFEWAIEEIVTLHPGLYLDHCAVMAVSVMLEEPERWCEFLVESDGFSPEITEGESRFLLRVHWTEETASKAARVRHSEQSRPIVERAAVGLAALVFGRLISNGSMRVTREKERADFWLPRIRRALEISGTEHAHEVQRRHREKVVQMLANPCRWDGYVFLSRFESGKRFIRWSFHSQEERERATI
jgi:hypothetical protein